MSLNVVLFEITIMESQTIVLVQLAPYISSIEWRKSGRPIDPMKNAILDER